MTDTKPQYRLGAVLAYTIIVLNILVGLVMSSLLGKALGQTDYGLYQALGSLVGSIMIMDFGLGSTVIRYVSKYRTEGDEAGMERFLGMIAVLYVGIGIIILLVGTVMYQFLPSFYDKLTPDQLGMAKKMVVVLVGNLMCSMLLNMFPAVLTAYEQFVLPRAAGICRIFLRAGLLLLMIRRGTNPLQVVILDTCLNVVYMSVNVCYVLFRLKIRFRWGGFDRPLLREVFTYSIFIFLNLIMSESYWNVGKIIMPRLDVALTSVVAVGFQVPAYFMEFSGALSGLFLPRATQMVVRSANSEELTDLMIRVGRLQMMVIALVVIGFALCGMQFLRLWMGEMLGDQIWHAYLIALMLIFALVVPLFQSTAISILQAMNRHAFRAVMLTFVAVLNILLTVVLVRRYGAVGTAISTTLSLIVGNVLASNWYYHKKVGLNIPRFFREGLRGILPAALLATAVSALTLLLPQAGFAWLLVRVVIILVVYVACMLTLGMNAGERALVRSLLSGAKRRLRKGDAHG